MRNYRKKLLSLFEIAQKAPIECHRVQKLCRKLTKFLDGGSIREVLYIRNTDILGITTSACRIFRYVRKGPEVFNEHPVDSHKSATF
jgi:hypothetical protein